MSECRADLCSGNDLGAGTSCVRPAADVSWRGRSLVESTAMKSWYARIFRGVLFVGLAATLPALSQNQPPQQNPKPGGAPGSSRPDGQKPGNGGSRPTPGAKPNPGGKPNPGPGKPGPGNPSVRPQPGRPGGSNPGRPGSGKPGSGGPPPRPNPPANRPPQNRPPAHRPPANHHRPPQWGRPPQNRPSYTFRPDNRDYLRRYYANRMRLINRSRRPVFVVGGYFPYADITYLSALPPDVYGQLPPPPPGYQMGYYDGYVVVYDPLTYFIANVIDLLQ